MTNQTKPHTVLLVDDEEDFRLATAQALSTRGYKVENTESGAKAIQLISQNRPDIVLLDLKMPGLSGIETLQKIRTTEKTLPVIILTGHGNIHNALAGINLEIVDFIQKPVDMDLLEIRIRRFFEKDKAEMLRERTISELIISPDLYPKLYVDEPIAEAMDKVNDAFFPMASGKIQSPKIRSALVYDRSENFLGLIRFQDLLKLVLPSFLEASPHTSYFTGMFLAQCKTISRKSVSSLMTEAVSVNIDAPIMEAIHLMAKHHLVTLPVMQQGKLVGILRERDIILEIAKNFGTLNVQRLSE
ncbi:MAG: response regulator [bacterium]